jgi:hypothetical protein
VFIKLVTAIFVSLAFAMCSFPCRIGRPVSPEEVVRKADVIVRASAESLVRGASVSSSYQPDSRVQFKVLEIVRGRITGDRIDLRGALVDTDDFNDLQVPYKLVRPDGLSGNCFATSYRAGAQYLLMLKRIDSGGYTVEWYALGPVNEQLHSTVDPWLIWVRDEARLKFSVRVEHKSRLVALPDKSFWAGIHFTGNGVNRELASEPLA